MKRMRDIIGDMREQAGMPAMIPKSQQRRLDIQTRARAQERTSAYARVRTPTHERKVDPVVEQAARSFHGGGEAAFGALDMIVKAGKRENAKEIKHHPNRKMVESHVPPKMRGTPLEGLIMDLGGGSSNEDLGISNEGIATPKPQAPVNVPGMESFLEQSEARTEDSGALAGHKDLGGPPEYSDENRLLRLRKDAERMVESLGGKVEWAD